MSCRECLDCFITSDSISLVQVWIYSLQDGYRLIARRSYTIEGSGESDFFICPIISDDILSCLTQYDRHPRICEIDDSWSDCIEYTIRIVYLEYNNSIWWALFEYFQESILCSECCSREMSEYIYMFALIWHKVDIYDTSSDGFYVEFLLVVRDIIGKYTRHTRLSEILIWHHMLSSDTR